MYSKYCPNCDTKGTLVEVTCYSRLYNHVWKCECGCTWNWILEDDKRLHRLQVEYPKE